MLKQKAAGLLVLVLIAWAMRPTIRASAQAPGYAEITSPSAGQSMTGMVTIEGTADHPAFLRYDLAFGYDPNPTDTWYFLGESVPTRARESTLGLWDTSGLTSGTYQLRLRVFLEGGAVLEDTVGDLRVGLPAAAPVATGASPSATASPPPAAAVTQVPFAPELAQAADPVVLALGIGGFMAAAFLVILAAFFPLRRGLALWAGSLRMRRVLRQDQRRRRGRGGP